MQTKQKTMKQIQEEEELEELYGIVRFITKDGKITTSESVYAKFPDFGNNIVKIIKALHEGPKQISAVDLPRVLIILINKILTIKNVEYFDKWQKLLSHFEVPATELERIKYLYNICKNEPFKSIMINLQSRFITTYLLHAHAPVLQHQQEKWRLKQYLSYGVNGDLQWYQKQQQELQRLEREEPAIRAKYARFEQFCNNYEIEADSAIEVGATSAASGEALGNAASSEVASIAPSEAPCEALSEPQSKRPRI